jgi:rare lipoprotein A (peptidoglycan hydrolase)
MSAASRDLSASDHWHRSLERSRRRRALAAAARKTRSRRQRTSLLLSAAVAAAPALPSLAVARVTQEAGSSEAPLLPESENKILLERGASGLPVTVVQRALAERDLLVSVDGYYGPETEHGVSAFQRANNLPVTGKVDLRTFLALVPHQGTSSSARPHGPFRSVILGAAERSSPGSSAQLPSSSGGNHADPFAATGKTVSSVAGGVGHERPKSRTGPESNAAATFVSNDGHANSAGARESGDPSGSGHSSTPGAVNAPPQGERPRLPAPGSPSQARWNRSLASWYGPGLYGNRTACGLILRASTHGVAHRSLACGTLITFSYRGLSITVPVIDRGPFIGSRVWDLTEATARALGFTGVGVDYVQWRPAGPERSPAVRATASESLPASSSSPQTRTASAAEAEPKPATATSETGVETTRESKKTSAPPASGQAEAATRGSSDDTTAQESGADTGGEGTSPIEQKDGAAPAGAQKSSALDQANSAASERGESHPVEQSNGGSTTSQSAEATQENGAGSEGTGESDQPAEATQENGAGSEGTGESDQLEQRDASP